MAAPPLLQAVPPRVLEELCGILDSLTDGDWVRLASRVIPDQTELRRLKGIEKTGVSITRELMWWWGLRLATVRDLLVLLQEEQLYRARDVILNWYTGYCAGRAICEASSDDAGIRNALASPAKNDPRPKKTGLSGYPSPDSSPELTPGNLPGPPPPPESLLQSLSSGCDSEIELVKAEILTHIPQQETRPGLPGCSLLWTLEEVKRATNGFSEENKTSSSIFADVYSGRRGHRDYAIKRLKEDAQCYRQSVMEMFFHQEVQICLRCSHENLLKMLGCCVEAGFLCLAYQHMPNGSLDRALESREGAVPMTWQRRIAISLGLLQAVRHLHDARILHGNIKSSNVLLDENFTPRLGHAGVRFHRTADYTLMKTKTLNVCQAYLPEEFIRSGQLTEGVDVFGCGIVLAEILTGRKAMEEGRPPIYLKELILEEIQRAKEILRSEGKSVKASGGDMLPAKAIIAKHLQGGAGPLPEEAALLFASAVCMCLRLRKDKATVAEIYAVMERVELQRRCPCNLEKEHVPVLQMEMLSVNYPEETNDYSFLSEYSGGVSAQATGATALPCSPHGWVISPLSRIPCESDESDVFSVIPAELPSASFLPVNGSVSPASCTSPVDRGPAETGRIQDMARKDGAVETERCSGQEATNAATLEDGPSGSSTSRSEERDSSELDTTPMGAETNEAKKKMLERIAQFKEGKIDSYELLSLH